MTVERGRTRCPRCMAWADYRFLENGENLLEYAVNCEACGNLHSEVASVPTAPPAAA